MRKKLPKTSWKTVQSRIKIQKKEKLALLVLGLLFLVLIFGQASRIVPLLFQPLSLASFSKPYHWDGHFNINLVVRGKATSVLVLDPKEKKVSFIKIPDDTYLEVPGGFGSWKLGAIFDLGEKESPPQGAKFLKKSLGSVFGLPIDGYLRLDVRVEDWQFLQSIRGNPLKFALSFRQIKTDLTPIELLRLIFSLSSIRFDKWQSFNLLDLELLEQTRLPNGDLAYLADPLKLDSFVANTLYDSQIRKEGVTVAVFNGTQSPGLAGKASRLITNLGGNVITSANTDKISQSVVISNELRNVNTLKRLRQIFAPACQDVRKCDTIDPKALNSRAQINVVLGEDF